MISPTRNELLAQLVTYVSLATELDESAIIRGKQNAPSPINAYCSILYINDVADGTSNIVFENLLGGEPLYKMRGKRHYSFSVQFYRDNATDLAKQLMMFNETPAGIEFQQQAYFIIRNIESITESAVVASNNYEERAVLTVQLTVNETQDIMINRVNTIPVELEADNGSILSEDIEIQ